MEAVTLLGGAEPDPSLVPSVHPHSTRLLQAGSSYSFAAESAPGGRVSLGDLAGGSGRAYASGPVPGSRPGDTMFLGTASLQNWEAPEEAWRRGVEGTGRAQAGPRG